MFIWLLSPQATKNPLTAQEWVEEEMCQIFTFANENIQRDVEQLVIHIEPKRRFTHENCVIKPNDEHIISCSNNVSETAFLAH